MQNLWADRPFPWTGSSVSAMMSTQRACPEQLRKTNRRHCEGRPRPAATWDSCRFPHANRRWPDNLLSRQRYADRKPDTRSSRTWRTSRRRRAQISRSASLSQAPAQESRIFLTPHESAHPARSFRTEQADVFSFHFAPAKWSACGERKLSSSSCYSCWRYIELWPAIRDSINVSSESP